MFEWRASSPPGASPTSSSRVFFRTKPSLAVLGPDDRVIVVFLTAYVIDFLSRVDRDVSLDVALRIINLLGNERVASRPQKGYCRRTNDDEGEFAHGQ
jgi:hypothetical protein